MGMPIASLNTSMKTFLQFAEHEHSSTDHISTEGEQGNDRTGERSGDFAQANNLGQGQEREHGTH